MSQIWFIHWKLLLAGGGLLPWIFFLYLRVWVGGGEPASACVVQQKPAPVPSSAEETQWKHSAVLLKIVFGHRRPVGGNTSPPLYYFVSAEMYGFFFYSRLRSNSCSRPNIKLQQFCPRSWRGKVTNCLTFFINTVFNIVRGFWPSRC